MNTAPAVVLVVEDDPLVRATLVMILRGNGFQVLEAADAQSADWWCIQTRPNIALIDYRLPGTCGCELIKRLHDSFGIASVLLTGSDDPALDALARSAGAVAILRKPLDMSRVPVTIAHLVAGRCGPASSCTQGHVDEFGTLVKPDGN